MRFSCLRESFFKKFSQRGEIFLKNKNKKIFLQNKKIFSKNKKNFSVATKKKFTSAQKKIFL